MKGTRMQLITRLLIVSVVVFATAWSVPLWATETYYVGKSGSDGNSCATAQSSTAGNRKLTIRAGIECASASDTDTVIVGAGTYSEIISTNSYTIASGSSFANALTVRVDAGATVTINGAGGEVINLADGMSYFILDGSGGTLVVDAQNATGRYVMSTTNGTNHIRLQNLELKNAGASCVLITKGSQSAPAQTFHEFINVTVHDCGFNPTVPPQAHGYYFSTGGNLIQGGEVYDNSGYGIQVFNQDGADGGPQTVDNTVIDRVYLHGTADFGAVILSSGSNSVIKNSVVCDGQSIGVEVGYRAVDPKIYNNTICNQGGYGIRVGALGSGTSGTLITNNHVIGSAAGQIELTGGTGTVQTTNRTTGSGTDCWVSSSDFHQKVGSSCLDVGTDLTSSGVTNDFDQVSRPQGSAFDIGAYELLVSAAGQPSMRRTQGIQGMRLLRHGRSGW